MATETDNSRTGRPGPDPYPPVVGQCPSCRGSSLFLGAGGHVTCCRLDCLRPDAADELLSREGQAAAAKDGRQRDLLIAELLRQEHEALRWERPSTPPEWTRQMRERLDIAWVPGCCATCSTSPARFYRDFKRWPPLHGWTPSDADLVAAAEWARRDGNAWSVTR